MNTLHARHPAEALRGSLGSAVVRIGATAVTASVVCEFATPTDDHPADGFLGMYGTTGPRPAPPRPAPPRPAPPRPAPPVTVMRLIPWLQSRPCTGRGPGPGLP
jgi:hypothetical protein